MLPALLRYASKETSEAEPGFKRKFVAWLIDCFEEGISILPAGDRTKKKNCGLRFEKCPQLEQYELVSKKGGKERKGEKTYRCQFLVDSAEIVALYGKNSDTRAIRAKHDFFVMMLNEAAQTMPEIRKAATLLAGEKSLKVIREALEMQGVKPADDITLRVNNVIIVEKADWHDWWRAKRRSLYSEGGASAAEALKITSKRTKQHLPAMRCYATGELAMPAERHPKVEGLWDVGGRGQDNLVCFDKDAFCSYGLIASSNAAISEQAAWKYRAALEDLVEKQSCNLGGAKVLYWFKEKIQKDDDPLAWWQEGEEGQQVEAKQRANQLLRSIHSGEKPYLAKNQYYAATVSAFSGRIMVRDWMEGEFAELVENIDKWFRDLEIIGWSGNSSAKTPGIERVVTSLLPPRRRDQEYRDWVVPLGSVRIGLWRAAVSGSPITYSVLSRVVTLNSVFHQRGELEQALYGENRAKLPLVLYLLQTRMALIKAYHIRARAMKGAKTMAEERTCYLNEDHPHPAYHCGRLLALYARVQREALGSVGAGVVQRYYGAASTTPALVLGRLTKTAQYHLGSLSKEKKGLAVYFDQRLSRIWCRIKDSIPTTLTIEEQSLFALGYYQELAFRKADALDNNKENTDEQGHN